MSSSLLQPSKKTPKRVASKTTAAYWMAKVYREKKGKWICGKFSVRIQAKGERRKVGLESSIKEDAAREALSKYLEVLAKGWPSNGSLRITSSPSSNLPNNPTVDQWISFANARSAVRKETLEKYAESLRTIVGELLGIPRARKKEDRARIGAHKISGLSKQKLQTWVDGRMERVRSLDMAKSPRAQNTLRTLVANARGLFSAQILDSIQTDRGEIDYIPFKSLRLPPKVQTRYSSRFDAKLLLAKGLLELGTAKADCDDSDNEGRFEQWKILYLALVAGLRYKEIDQLRVEAFSTTAERISIRTHETFRPKTISSEGDVLVSQEAGKILAQMIKRADGPWFVKSGKSVAGTKYRAGLYHDLLVRWLRSYEERGMKPFADLPKPIHELRKEAGTLVNSGHGLNEAKNFLRHSSIATTAAFYVGTKGTITTGLS